jgi:hypothetical protein
MRRSLYYLLILSVILSACSSGKRASQPSAEEGWVTLFNGRNLDGWKPKIAGFPYGENFGNTFRVANEILSTRYDQYGNFNERFGAIYYNKKFSNFRLKVEYRFVGELTPGAPAWGFRDGGINYLGQDPASMEVNQKFPITLEYNLLGGNGKDERPTGEICAAGIAIDVDGKRNTLFCTPPVVKRTFPGDEWVTAEIEVRNGQITHFVNGEQILQFTNPRFDPSNEIAKKFILNGDDLVKEGFISLQSNSHPMDFRKVEIMEFR